jgi:tetrahydromethanopterin S-methyltransferase subunit G
MTAKTRLTPVVAVLLVALGDGGSSVGSARAAENCLAAPNAQAPQGSHWYYRTDPVKQNKCWYLRAEGQAIQKPSAPEGPDPTVTAKWPAAATSKTAPDQSAPAVSGGNLMRGSIQGGAQASRQPSTDTVAWPDPPSSAGAAKVAWPDPPSPATGAMQGAAAESTPEERANQTQEIPATTANSDKAAGTDAEVERQVAEPIENAVSQSGMPVGILLAVVIGLIIAGITVRRIVRTFARRRRVYPDQREPVRTASIASERTKLTFVVHDTDCLDDEVKDALRKIVRVLDRQAV